MRAAIARRNIHIPPHLIGVALVTLGCFIVPVNDAIAKHLSATYPILLIVWARNVFFLAPVAIGSFMLYGRKVLQPRNPLLQISRGLLLVFSTALFFAALRTTPMTDALALVFVAPFVVTAAAAVLLKEPVGVRRWSAVAVGFIGALIVIRPGLEEVTTGSLLALGAGFAIGIYFVMTRMVSEGNAGLISLVYSALPATVLLTLALPFFWVPVEPIDWLKMVLMGLSAAAAHYLYIRAYARTNAALLAPFGYMEIVSNTLLGFFIFGDFPDAMTWLGIFVIIASGMYISIRERQSAS